MSYSPSDRCPDCGRFQDCRCVDVEPDTCVHCDHPVDEHGAAGCEHTEPITAASLPVVGATICPCSNHPEPFDYSAP